MLEDFHCVMFECCRLLLRENAGLVWSHFMYNIEESAHSCVTYKNMKMYNWRSSIMQILAMSTSNSRVVKPLTLSFPFSFIFCKFQRFIKDSLYLSLRLHFLWLHHSVKKKYCKCFFLCVCIILDKFQIQPDVFSIFVNFKAALEFKEVLPPLVPSSQILLRFFS